MDIVLLLMSCIPAMMWWWCGGSAISYPNEVLGSTPHTWLNGLALSYILLLTLSGAPKILLYCTEYNRPTTQWHFKHGITHLPELLTNEGETYFTVFCTHILKFVDDKINYLFSLAFTTNHLTVYHNLVSYQMMTMMKLTKCSGKHLHMCFKRSVQ